MTNEEIQERKIKLELARDIFNNLFSKDKPEYSLLQKYKKGIAMKKKGIPDWFNTYNHIIKNPEYYLGPEPKNGYGEHDE